MEERYPDYVAPKEEDDDDDASSTTLRLSRVLLDDHENMLYKQRDSRDETSCMLHVLRKIITIKLTCISIEKQIPKLFSINLAS